AQKRLESENFSRRKTVLEYDDVMNLQRTVIYKQRQEVLEGADISGKIKAMIADVIETAVAEACGEEGIDFSHIKEKLAPHLTGQNDEEIEKCTGADELTALLKARAEARYKYQESVFGDNMRELERIILLRTVDQNWMDHLAAMDDLRDGIGLNAYAQRKPIVEYKIASADMFDEMTETIKRDTVKALMLVSPKRPEQVGRPNVKIKSVGAAAPATEKRAPVVKKASEKIGRNDPCPCGSGKKYKNCCMLKEND
ncbi:MAG: SEC-C domain-containing protein, partial [Clostridia bacterium]|nr:SEC-C domain-containing protein [Clostridia bacterium]